MDKSHDIAGILITYFIDEKQALFILLQNDGAINRMGSASLEDAESTLCIGQTNPSVFESLKAMIHPEFLKWFGGQRVDPAPKGHLCELTLVLVSRDNTELVSAWKYGSDSIVPPPDIVKFVLQAMKLTDPWYAAQQQQASSL